MNCRCLFQAHIRPCLSVKKKLFQAEKINKFVLYVFRVHVLNCYVYLRVWSVFCVRFCCCRSSVLTIIVDNVIIMLENCSSHQNCNCGKRSAFVIGKLAKVFGRRKTYQVQKAQQLNKLSSIDPGESSNSWVTVHSLQSQSDGGILDPDDRLRDVADDREQIVALYDDGDSNSPHQHGGGDGASVTSSPDMFHSRDGLQTDIEVTNEQIACGFPALHVRRGSEPALNQLPLECPNNLGKRNNNTRPAASGQSKRWSAAPMIHDPKEKLRTDDYMKINGFGLSDKWRCSEEDEDELELGDKDKPPISNHFLAPSFHRDSSNRLSMQFLGESSSGFRWAEAADLANNRALSLSLPRDHRRKEPLGQANTNPSHLPESQNTEYIVLSTGGGSLGIHVVPDYNALGKERGLLVQGIEPGGRVHCDGRLKVYDRIVEINGRSLLDQPFNAIQEIFRDSLHSSELRLRVVKHKNNIDMQTSQNTAAGNKKQPPPPVFPKPSSNTNATYSNKENVSTGSSDKDKVNSNTKIATISPTKKISAATHTASNILMVANTRKIGKKMELELTKGLHGLGFSITTRDNPAGGNCPIYIKNVLPKGAAVEDGRLRPGDRLLAVNGTELTGKTQSEAVAVLRKVPSGAKVKIIVSRQEDVVISQVGQKSNQDLDENYEQEVGISSENQLVETNDKSNSNTVQEYVKSLEETQTFPWRHKEILTFDIPVHDSEKAGLGISVKGKTSSSNNSNDKDFSQDLGIFIKNVIHGGAASRDGRLRTNDQLLHINGISLIGQTNAAAMETLRRTMMNVDPGPVPGAISLIVARRRNSSPTLDRRRSRDSSSSLLTDSSANTETFSRAESSDSSTQNTAENSGTSENSDTTVIFMHQRQGSESSKRNSLHTTTSPDGIAIRNPVLERLTGHTNRYNALRNESYYKATHQTTIFLKEEEKLNSPTVNPSSEEMLIIEEDPPNYNTVSRKKIEEDKPSPIISPQARTGSTSTDVTYASQLSLDNANSGFSRDAFGRQSMSEKRHATLDAKNTDTYQRNKKLREERGDDTKIRNGFPSKHQLGPSLGLKKSSSLESLQTMVQEVQMTDGASKRGNVKVVRGRGCDESFRAAVDKDGPLSLHELRLETYGKESDDHPIGRRQSSLHSPTKYKAPTNTPPVINKKKPGLLKGIGSMFRFGSKPRRSQDLNGTLSSEEDNSADREREIARKNARDEQLRIQEQYQRLIQRQAEMQEQNHSREIAIDNGTANYTNVPVKPSNPEQSRMDRIQQLRAEHQRRHMERSGKFIPDERDENHYESDIRQPIGNTQNAINRPGSRVGIIDSSRFNHYVNFQEIQQNLSLMHEIRGVKLRHHGKTKKPVSCYYDTDDESRRQLHYHSQRRDPKESVARPSSNYYEYESVMRSLPYTTGGTSRLVDNNSNSLTRQVGSVTQTTAVAATNNNNNGAGRSQKQQSLSRHHYPVPTTKSPNYAMYGSGDPQGHNNMQQQQLQHRGLTNNNYTGAMYHHHNQQQQQQQRSSPQQGPYITQVTIRDNKHIIKSPNI